MSIRSNSVALQGSLDGQSSAYSQSDAGNSDLDTTYGESSLLDTSVATPVKDRQPERRSLESPPGVPSLALGALVPTRSELPRVEGAAEAEEEARLAAEEAHRKALLAERKLAASEWAALRTPRPPPKRALDILDVVYDAGEERFQEWVPNSSFFKRYIQLLYGAAVPLQSHPLKDIDVQDLPSEDGEATPPAGNHDSVPTGSKLNGTGGKDSESNTELPPVTPRTRKARFKALFTKQSKANPAADKQDAGKKIKGMQFFSRSRSIKRNAQERMEAEAAEDEVPQLPMATVAVSPDTAPQPINHAYRTIMEEMEHDAKVQQAELRRRLTADGNGAAADALRVEAAGFDYACDFKEESVDVVAEQVFDVLSANGMECALPLSYAGVPLAVMAELEECLEEMVWGTQVFTRRWGVSVRDLLARTSEWTQRNCSRWTDTETYFQIGRSLNLSANQRNQILAARAYLTDALDRLYLRRQQLNESIFELLQPPPPQTPDYLDTLRAALEELRENLAEEQRISSQTEFVCWKQILNPCQGAWAVLKAMPEHCDILALFNVVAEIYA